MSEETDPDKTPPTEDHVDLKDTTSKVKPAAPVKPPIEGKVDLSQAENVNPSEAKVDDLSRAARVTPPEAPAGPLTGLQGAGVNLAKWVLLIIVAFLLVSILLLLYSEITNTNLLNRVYTEVIAKDPNSSAGTAFVEHVKAQRKEFRDFWIQLEQMVLLNLLLPVLTAILGYVFATREKGTSN